MIRKLIIASMLLYSCCTAFCQLNYQVDDKDIQAILSSSDLLSLDSIHTELQVSYANDLLYSQKILSFGDDYDVISESMDMIPYTGEMISVYAEIEFKIWSESDGSFKYFPEINTAQRRAWNTSRYFDICREAPEFIGRLIMFASLYTSGAEEHADELGRVATLHPSQFLDALQILDEEQQKIIFDMLYLGWSESKPFVNFVSKMENQESKTFMMKWAKTVKEYE